VGPTTNPKKMKSSSSREPSATYRIQDASGEKNLQTTMGQGWTPASTGAACAYEVRTNAQGDDVAPYTGDEAGEVTDVLELPLSESEKVAVIVATTIIGKRTLPAGTPNLRRMEDLAVDMEGDYVFALLEQPYEEDESVDMTLKLDRQAARTLAATLREATNYQTRPGLPAEFIESMWMGLVVRCSVVADRLEELVGPEPSLAQRLGTEVGRRIRRKRG
jgi:hypothetical protein